MRSEGGKGGKDGTGGKVDRGARGAPLSRAAPGANSLEVLPIEFVGSFPDPNKPLASARRLYLTLKAEDLAALRAKTITRDEARARIIEQRY